MNRYVIFTLQLSLTICVCLFLLVPIAMSILASFTENYFIGIKSGFTLRWIQEVWAMYANTFWLSLIIALSCLCITIALGLPTAWALLKSPSKIATYIEECLMLPVAIPGMATALGLLLIYGSFREFRESWAFILVGHVLFTLPFMVRSILVVMKSSHLHTLDEAAASLGASPRQRFFNVIIPNCVTGILAGAFAVITLSIGEFNITWMLHTPMTKTLPVGLADSYASMRLEVGSAYTTLFFVMIIPLLLTLHFIRHLVSPSSEKKI
ncbi:ABC transporter permease [Acinetobacter boissieri]|uniref:Putative spermidine/putrescine transport system permease protein n=1 Tax=Acinetobacter boissieri TaxID=1219383 RepID=A0A1G6H173_9GAMM|nr:ABC transporter permease subunit [Acinetobacter boissieri]SDB87941.1 putative spermidine/putrescine transport system permease protein [Acinetobacter boissieri]